MKGLNSPLLLLSMAITSLFFNNLAAQTKDFDGYTIEGVFNVFPDVEYTYTILDPSNDWSHHVDFYLPDIPCEVIGTAINAQGNFTITIKWLDTNGFNSSSEMFFENNQTYEWVFLKVDFRKPFPDPISEDQNFIKTTTYKNEGVTLNNSSTIGISYKTQNITYYDGFSRPIQNIQISGDLTTPDIITPFDYDDFGRQVRTYLPYANNSYFGDIRQEAIKEVHQYYEIEKYNNAINPYSEKKVKNSASSITTEIAAPGQDWALDSGHTIKFVYRNNIANEVKHFSVSHPNNNTEQTELEFSGYYLENELYKTVTKDENWVSGTDHTTEEFKNKQGQVILKRTYNSSASETNKAHDTQYVYDNFGNLTYVLPPKASDAIENLGVIPLELESTSDLTSTAIVNQGATLNLVASNSIRLLPNFHAKSGSSFSDIINQNSTSNTVLSGLCYIYHYDYRNRLVEKKIPGKGWEYIVYDKLDRPILTQDANMRLENKWLFTKYDAFSRVVYTGAYTTRAGNTNIRLQLQNQANTQTNAIYEAKLTGTTTNLDGLNLEYTNQTLPTNNLELYTINYYDDYNFSFPSQLAYSDAFGAILSANNKSLSTGSKIRILGTNQWITSLSYYDTKGRPIFSSSKNNFLNTLDIIKNKLDFVGKVLETESKHIKDINAVITLNDVFTYDHANRLLTQSQSINSATPEVIVNNQYDELGLLIKKKVGGKLATNTAAGDSNGLQTVDYSYNIRGWLKSINNGSTANNDLFGFKLNYNTTTLGATNSQALYNGNISETHWVTANDNNTRSYSYNYDALNRIKKADYFGNYTVANTNNNIEDYGLKNIAYDKNGNINNLERSGLVVNNNTSQIGVIDKLTYNYTPFSNTLSNVSDTATQDGFKDGNATGNDYTYDTNGNMTVDKNKRITNIEYNHLNLPTQITFNSRSRREYINYAYDATGVKLMKTVSKNTGAYILTSETAYANNFIYRKSVRGGRPNPNAPEPRFELQFFSHPEGYLQPKNESDLSQGFDYVYQFKDHLGNIRLSYSDSDGNGDIDAATEIIEENNYYPFGLEHKGYNNVVNGTENNYKTFQGQEIHKELGLNWIEFKYRNYDPTIGRFFNVDPLAEDYVYNGPYNFAENRVIDGIELEGLEWKSVKDDDGNTNLTLTVQLYNEAGLSDKQLTKLKTSITEQFTESYSSSDENITASLVIEDTAEAKGDFLVTLTEQTSSPVYDDDGNKTGITYKGGKAGALGKTQKNDFEVTAKRDGSKRSNSDISRSFSHEAGHTAGLRHPWSAKQAVGDIKQGATGVTASTVRKNLMNSGGNKVKANRSTSGTQVTKGQLKSIDKLVRGQQK